jgi:hypothetical protein
MKERIARMRVDSALLTSAGKRLTERDRAICEALYEHRVLTGDQLRELYFINGDRARHRLLELHRLRAVDRFRPYRPHGSAPYHYVLDELGAAVVATERGLETKELDWSRSKALKLASSSQLTHLVEANGFFVTLIAATRRSAGVHVTAWWGQRRCTQAWGELVRPDGYAALAYGGDVRELCLEWDRGTEALARIEEKLARYGELQSALERPLTLALVAPTGGRERELQRVTRRAARTPVLVTTAARHAADPLGQNWLGTGDERRQSVLHTPTERRAA